MKTKKLPKEKRIHLLAPVDKLSLEVLKIGGILDSKQVKGSLKIKVSLRGEITYESDIALDTVPNVDQCLGDDLTSHGNSLLLLAQDLILQR